LHAEWGVLALLLVMGPGGAQPALADTPEQTTSSQLALDRQAGSWSSATDSTQADRIQPEPYSIPAAHWTTCTS
jgi:hypothetical protein